MAQFLAFFFLIAMLFDLSYEIFVWKLFSGWIAIPLILKTAIGMYLAWRVFAEPFRKKKM